VESVLTVKKDKKREQPAAGLLPNPTTTTSLPNLLVLTGWGVGCSNKKAQKKGWKVKHQAIVPKERKTRISRINTNVLHGMEQMASERWAHESRLVSIRDRCKLGG
jgi:hypothetical protein